jgi:hypothetical protein
MKPMKILVLTSLIIASIVAVSEAGWLIYHEPEFKGTILDIETKQPIEGAVVVVEYMKSTWWLSPHSTSSIMDVRETLTDKEGKFRIPSYTTFMQPFSSQIPTLIIIFKPGYASISNWNIGEVFTKGIVKEDEVPWLDNMDLKFRFAPWLIELPKLKTKEERWDASFVGVTGYSEKELPLLYKALSEKGNN